LKLHAAIPAVMLLALACAMLLPIDQAVADGHRSTVARELVSHPSPFAGQIDSPALAPDVASYDIQATLSADGKTIEGREAVRYRNPSPDALQELYLHHYLNAFRSADTIWMREAGGGHRGFAFDPDEAGWIDVHSIAVGDQPLSLELDPDGTIARVGLPQPLLPNDELTLTVGWTSRLPRVFARTGWAPGGFSMVGQWYPKLAVYDPRHGGWDREPWHANAEFFHDFGSYRLALTVPLGRDTVIANGEPDGPAHDNGDGTATWRFTARSVTDSVWMAAERFAVRAEQRGGITIEVALPAERAGEAGRYLDAADYAIRRYAEWLFPYPWPRLAVIVPPTDAQGAGGMEYPALFTSTLGAAGLGTVVRELEIATVHELAHQWFPMQVASDEARDPWLDEALADYLTLRVMAERFGADGTVLDLPFARLSYLALMRSQLPVAASIPITKPSWEYSPAEYGAVVYAKGSLLLTTLERQFGREPFTAALRDYAEQWRWRHPTAADFRAALIARLDRRDADEGRGPGPIAAWLDQLAFGERIVGLRVDATGPLSATVTRVGDAALPLEGVIALRSGSRLPWYLAAETNRQEVVVPAGDAIVAVEGDPESRLLVEPDRLDDNLAATPLALPVVGVWARLVELLALLLQSAGQFG
jgi:hypothetical protein